MAISGSLRICSGALLTSAVVLTQISVVFFPFLGPVLNVAGTLFIGAAAALLGRRALYVLLLSALSTLLINPRYACEFLLTTGLAGVPLGLFLWKKPFYGLLAASAGLFLGLVTITGLFGSAAAGCAALLPFSACLPVFAVFSPAYCIISRSLLKRFIGKMATRPCVLQQKRIPALRHPLFCCTQ